MNATERALSKRDSWALNDCNRGSISKPASPIINGKPHCFRGVTYHWDHNPLTDQYHFRCMVHGENPETGERNSIAVAWTISDDQKRIGMKQGFSGRNTSWVTWLTRPASGRGSRHAIRYRTARKDNNVKDLTDELEKWLTVRGWHV